MSCLIEFSGCFGPHVIHSTTNLSVHLIGALHPSLLIVPIALIHQTVDQAVQLGISNLPSPTRTDKLFRRLQSSRWSCNLRHHSFFHEFTTLYCYRHRLLHLADGRQYLNIPAGLILDAQPDRPLLLAAQLGCGLVSKEVLNRTGLRPHPHLILFGL